MFFVVSRLAGFCVLLTILSGLFLITLSTTSSASNSTMLVRIEEADGNGELYALDLYKNILHRMTYTPTNERAPLWSPDGQQVLVIRDNIPMILSPSGRMLHQFDTFIAQAEWSPDSQKLAMMTISAGSTSLISRQVIIIEDGEVIARSPELSFVKTIRWTLDNESIHVLVSRQEVYSVYSLDITTGEATLHGDWVDGTQALSNLTLSPHETTFIGTYYIPYRHTSHEIVQYNAQDETMSKVTHHIGIDNYANWSPNGQHLSIVSDRDGVANLYLLDRNTLEPQKITDLSSDVWYRPTWSTDSQSIAFQTKIDDVLHLCEVDIVTTTTACHIELPDTNADVAIRP